MQATHDGHGPQRPEADSVERAIAIIGDAWVFLILRELFFGERRFDRFQKGLKVAPNILTGRLKLLLEAGLIGRRLYSERPPRHEYHLTEKGRDLYPAIVMIMRWADKWLDEGRGPPLELIHKDCGQPMQPECRCDVCGKTFGARDATWRQGPGADSGADEEAIPGGGEAL